MAKFYYINICILFMEFVLSLCSNIKPKLPSYDKNEVFTYFA